MEAHEVTYGTKVIVTDNIIRTPPGALVVNKGDEITIHKLDGMYCSGINKDGDKIYITAWTEVEPQTITENIGQPKSKTK
jgi:hypothetical protein